MIAQEDNEDSGIMDLDYVFSSSSERMEEVLSFEAELYEGKLKDISLYLNMLRKLQD